MARVSVVVRRAGSAGGARRRLAREKQLHSRVVFWRIRTGPPGAAGGGTAAVGLGTRDSEALTIRMIYCFGGFVTRERHILQAKRRDDSSHRARGAVGQCAAKDSLCSVGTGCHGRASRQG